MILSLGSDNLVTVTGVQDPVTGSFLDAATVTGSLLLAAPGGGPRPPVPGSSFNLTYVVASQGVYQGTIPLAVINTLTLGVRYVVEVVIVSAGVTTTADKTLPANYYTGG